MLQWNTSVTEVFCYLLFPAGFGAEMRQSSRSLCTRHKTLHRHQKCWTVARMACGQTVINTDTLVRGVCFTWEKLCSKLMKIFLAERTPYFKGEIMNRDLPLDPRSPNNMSTVGTNLLYCKALFADVLV